MTPMDYTDSQIAFALALICGLVVRYIRKSVGALLPH